MKQQTKLILFSAIFIVLGLAIYLPSLNYSFQFDDLIHISQNPDLTDFDQYKDISYWTNHLRRPVSRFSFSVSEIWADGDPAGHRIVNIILHFINAVLVFFLFKKIISLIDTRFQTNRNLALPLALFTAGVFLVHPMQSQSIVYIVQRMNLLSSLFTLSALILYIMARTRIRDNKHLGSAIAFLVLAIIASVTGIFAKQNAAVTAMLIFLIEAFIFNGKGRFERLFRGAVLAGIPLAVASFFIIYGITGTKGSGTTPVQYFISQWPVYLHYLQLYFVPIGQNIDHMVLPYTPPISFKYIGALILNLALIITAIFGKKFPLVRFGILWFYLAHSIESRFIPIHHIMVDHRNYLPYAGITVCLGSFIFFPVRNNNNRLVIVSLIVLYFSLCSFFRVKEWKSMETIWLDSVEKKPENKRGWNNLSYAFLETDPEQAKVAAIKAINYDSCYYQAYDNLGAAFMRLGDTLRAKQSFINSIKCNNTNNYIAYYNLGVCYTNEDESLAMEYFKKVLELSPDNESVRKKIGGLQVRNGLYAEAIENFTMALKIDPDDISNYINLAIVYDEAGKPNTAIKILLPYANDSVNMESVYRILANLYGRISEFHSAEAMITKAIAINPSIDNYLKRGFIREHYSNYKGAIEDYNIVNSRQESPSLEQRILDCEKKMNK